MYFHKKDVNKFTSYVSLENTSLVYTLSKTSYNSSSYRLQMMISASFLNDFKSSYIETFSIGCFSNNGSYMMTCFFSIKDDIVHAGANYVDEAVVVDGHLVTSRTPKDLPVFVKTFIQVLEK